VEKLQKNWPFKQKRMHVHAYTACTVCTVCAGVGVCVCVFDIV